MPKREVPYDVVARLAALLQERIEKVAVDYGVSARQQTVEAQISRNQLRELSRGMSGEGDNLANPRLDMLIAVSRYYGIAITIDAATPDVVSFEVDDDVLTRHRGRLGPLRP